MSEMVTLHDGRAVDRSAPLPDLLDALVVLGDCLSTAAGDRASVEADILTYKAEIMRRYVEPHPQPELVRLMSGPARVQHWNAELGQWEDE